MEDKDYSEILNSFTDEEKTLITLEFEWDHSKNEGKKLSDYGKKDCHKVWWKHRCGCGRIHSWYATINKRYHGSSCGICAHKNDRLCYCKSLEFLYPKLTAQWDYEKNKEITPDKITPGSTKEVHWFCDKCQGHKWSASICNRSKGRGCPYCANSKVCPCGCNSLALKYPKIAAQWDYEKNGELTPDKVASKSHDEFYWICDKHKCHRWPASVASKTRRKTKTGGCPYCANKEVCPCKCNSFAYLHPKIAEQWDYEKNGEITPEHVTSGTQTRFHWICSKNKNHKWFSALNRRVIDGRGCPYCNESKGEKAIVNILDILGICYMREHNIKINSLHKHCRLDFYFDNKAIEFDGIQHFKINEYFDYEETTFKRRKQLDKLKSLWCVANNISLLRISYNDLPNIQKEIEAFLQLEETGVYYSDNYPEEFMYV